MACVACPEGRAFCPGAAVTAKETPQELPEPPVIEQRGEPAVEAWGEEVGQSAVEGEEAPAFALRATAGQACATAAEEVEQGGDGGADGRLDVAGAEQSGEEVAIVGEALPEAGAEIGQNAVEVAGAEQQAVGGERTGSEHQGVDSGDLVAFGRVVEVAAEADQLRGLAARETEGKAFAAWFLQKQEAQGQVCKTIVVKPS